ncbi:MAG TPA: GGDEF domain-containing protein [Fimbriimonadaceae bacterium]|nr:GGDEF domain-containing protein [Fimbriimonadaceae bacterium]
MMSSKLAPLFDLIDSAVELYRESALCRALCASIGSLVGLMIVDGILGFPTGTRMAYVLPLWLAIKKGGRNAGATVVILTTVSLALVDSADPGRAKSTLVNFATQTLVLYGLMMIFDSLESRLRNVTTLATRDSLTGLYNRHAIEERAKKAIDRATVLSQPLAIAMIDCDRFKELNDQYGHAFGDEVLRILAKTMRRGFASDATVGRTGGDEFIVILPNRDRYQALSLLEATLERFLSHHEISGCTSGFSYGVATVGQDGLEYDRLVRAADDDMYRTKASRSDLAATIAS